MNGSNPLDPPEVHAGQVLDAELHLLDRQVLDRDNVPISVVAEIELSDIPLDVPLPPDTPPPIVVALLSGPVLGTRIFGGRPPQSRWHRIPWRSVKEVGVAIRLGVDGDSLDVTWVERWMRDHIIKRIPGGSHDPG